MMSVPRAAEELWISEMKLLPREDSAPELICESGG